MMNSYSHLVHLSCPPEEYINSMALERVAQLALTPGSDPPSRLLRRAVKHQQMVLRQQLQLHDRPFCLDHHPIPFSSLRRIFLKQRGINPDNHPRDTLTVELLREWQAFHGAMAEYRVVDPQVHYLMGVGQSAYCENTDARLYLLG